MIFKKMIICVLDLKKAFDIKITSYKKNKQTFYEQTEVRIYLLNGRIFVCLFK